LQGFTKLAETTPGDQMIAMLNDYFGAVVGAVCSAESAGVAKLRRAPVKTRVARRRFIGGYLNSGRRLVERRSGIRDCLSANSAKSLCGGFRSQLGFT
jgi:hypothetical protein